MDKKSLLNQMQKDWKKYWDLEWFRKNGWARRQCKKCGKFFWSLAPQELCNDSSCRPYEFLGKPVTKGRFDYFKAWKAIRDFFVNEGHFEMERYPVICKWYPMFFTIAGIADFYRMDGKDFVFEYQKNPIILLQPSLRFKDIPQVGVSGRHLTCHSHVEQFAAYNGGKGYWKDRCIELDFRLLTKVFGIKPELINFVEDVWLGPGAFGYSLEYHIKGLEVGNAVFTEFAGTPGEARPLKEKIIDMGAGLERFCWLSQGTPTVYEASFGPVIEKMKEKSGAKYDEKFFLEYSKLAGLLNIDEVADIEAARADVARRLGTNPEALKRMIEPIQAIYAIADHTKALQFAIADTGLPSNVGGGYNLRVILRRALSFIDKYGFPFDLVWVAERMGRYLKPMHPELLESQEIFKEIVGVEEKRYRGSMERTRKAIEQMVEKGEEFTEQKLIELYDSQGITPEMVSEVTKVDIPADFYAKVTERHEKEAHEEAGIDVSGLKATEKLYLQKPGQSEFEARVLKVWGNRHVVLDRTIFYPRGGGQEPDHGELNGKKVYDVNAYEGVIVHEVESPDFKAGDTVKGRIDAGRRDQIVRHHTATHLVEAAAREVLGPWVWQAGSKKDVDKAHLDVTHYQALTKEQLGRIEKLVNDWVKKGLEVRKSLLPRSEAEKKYGFRIYQGAAVPSKILRICSIDNIEHEACGGLHVDNTKEVGKVIIFKAERPADGTVRLFYKSGPAALEYERKIDELLKESARLLKVNEGRVPEAVRKLFTAWKKKKKELDGLIEKKAEAQAKEIRFKKVGKLNVLVKEMPGATPPELREFSRKLQDSNAVVFLFGTTDRISLLASVGEEAVKSGISADALVKKACEKLGGGGGGSAAFAQGAGLNKEMLEKAKKEVERMLGA